MLRKGTVQTNWVRLTRAVLKLLGVPPAELGAEAQTFRGHSLTDSRRKDPWLVFANSTAAETPLRNPWAFP